MIDYNIIVILAVLGLFVWLIRSHDQDVKIKDGDRSIERQKKELAEDQERASCCPPGIL